MSRRARAPHPSRSPADGFTLVELMIVLALVGLLAGLSVSSYLGSIEKARVASAVSTIASLARILDGLAADDDAPLPSSLAEIGQAAILDPWGSPYRYLLIEGALGPGISATGISLPDVAAPPGSPPGGQGSGGNTPVIAQARKDGFLVPINSDYDLYSMGRDGLSNPTLLHPDSRDDVVRAGDGAYIGLAEFY